MKRRTPQVGDIVLFYGAYYYVTKAAKNKKEFNAFEIKTLDGKITFGIKRYEMERFLELIHCWSVQ